MRGGLVTFTVRADFLDDFAASAAVGTSDLRLGEHAGEDLLADDLDALAVAAWACVDVV